VRRGKGSLSDRAKTDCCRRDNALVRSLLCGKWDEERDYQLR
jgi:hypothetical protein